MPLLRLLGSPERCHSFHLSSSSFYGRLQNLEDIANRDRDNASAQAIFLKVRYGIFLMLIVGLVGKAPRVRCETVRERRLCDERGMRRYISSSS